MTDLREKILITVARNTRGSKLPFACLLIYYSEKVICDMIGRSFRSLIPVVILTGNSTSALIESHEERTRKKRVNTKRTNKSSAHQRGARVHMTSNTICR